MELLPPAPEIEAGTILPLCIFHTNEGCWDPGTSQAMVGCSEECNAKSRIYISTNLRIWTMPLCS
eukprot:scaffold71645_cov75-Attheya_sp.AAC.3